MSELSISNSSNLEAIEKQENLTQKMQDLPDPDRLVRQITRIIQNSSDLQTMLSKLAVKLGETFQGDTCIVANSSDRSATERGLWCSRKQQKLSLESAKKLWDNPRVAEILARAEAKDLATAEEAIQPLKSLLDIGTSFHGKVNGKIAIAQLSPREWTEEEIELLETVAETIGMGISLSQLQQKKQNWDRYETLLKDIGEAIRYNVEINSLRQKALEGTAKALEADKAAILMLKYKSPPIGSISPQQLAQIEARVVCEWSAETDLFVSAKQSPFPLSESDLCTEAFQNAPKPLALEGTRDFLDESNDNKNSQIKSAVLMLPLMGSITSDANTGVVLGFLLLQQDYDRKWCPDEIELANWVSTQLSTAILQDQALNKVQSIVDRRTAQLKWSLEVQGKLSEGMRQHIEQLRELNQLKDKFVETISHNLKTPLTTMRMAIEMLRQYGEYPDRRQRYIDFLDKAWTQENKLIQDLLTLQELESNRYSFTPQELDLKEIVAELEETFAQQQIKEQLGADKTVTLQVNYHPKPKSKPASKLPLTIYTDPKSIKQILSELLGNAAKYSEPNTSVELNISQKLEFESNKIVIEVTNHGVPISEAERSHIFDKFRRGEKATERREVPGLGVGLTLVKYLVEHISGSIEVSSDPTSDADIYINTFTVVLPQQPTQPQ